MYFVCSEKMFYLFCLHTWCQHRIRHIAPPPFLFFTLGLNFPQQDNPQIPPWKLAETPSEPTNIHSPPPDSSTISIHYYKENLMII